MRLRQLRKHTIENYVSDVRHFLKYYPEPSTITNNELERYLETLLLKKLTPSTMKSYFISLNAFYEMLLYKEETKNNPIPTFRKIFLPRRTQRPDKRQYIEYAKSDYLFITPSTGGKMHKDKPGNYLRKVGQELSIHTPGGALDERLTPHCWRWSFTTWMFQRGMREQHIKYMRGDILGSKEAWEGYLEINPRHVRKEWEKKIPKLLEN